MDNYEDPDANFEAVFSFQSDIAYDQRTIDKICKNRGLLANELFVDRLLKAIGIEKRKLSSASRYVFPSIS